MQVDIFPGSGKVNVTGPKKNIKNIGVPASSTYEYYIQAISEKSLPWLIPSEIYEEDLPELLILSAGYDALEEDPMASVSLKAEDFGEICKLVNDACETKGIPVIGGLEGGYSLSQLPVAVASALKAFSS